MLETVVGECRTYSDAADSHQHGYAQLLFPLRGQLFIETPENQHCLDDASLLFLPPNCPHYFYAQDHNECLVLDIPGKWVGDRLRTCPTSLFVALGERWQAIRSLLLTEFQEECPQESSFTYLIQYINHLLSDQISKQMSRQNFQQWSKLQIPESEFPSLRYLHSNYHTSIQISDLAKIEGYSVSYYGDWFRGQTGQTPKTYLHHLRLRAAKTLLQSTHLPIRQIAQQVGFDCASSLTRLFQQYEGRTPQSYRSLIRNSAKKVPKFSEANTVEPHYDDMSNEIN